MTKGKTIQDTDLEKVIGNLLRYGVLTASLIVLAGGVVYLVRHGGEVPSYGQFKGEPDIMRRPGPMLQAIFHGRGRPLIALGLLVLIATPIARIICSIVGYLLEKDWLYTVLTVIVLVVILWNF
jgi:uncharacterized membrane protein